MREKKMKENQSVGTAVYQPVSALNNPNYYTKLKLNRNLIYIIA